MATVDILPLRDIHIDVSKLSEVCRNFGIQELWVFGSAARGEMTATSDLDLMVEFDPAQRIGLFRFEELIEELQSLTTRRVDLVTKHGLKPSIRSQVLADARILYAA